MEGGSAAWSTVLLPRGVVWLLWRAVQLPGGLCCCNGGGVAAVEGGSAAWWIMIVTAEGGATATIETVGNDAVTEITCL